MTETEQQTTDAADAGAPEGPERGRRIKVQGVVHSDKMDKTIVVRVDRLVKHPTYKKYVKRRSTYYAHDEANEAEAGDRVEIVQTRPLSKKKRWRLVRVVRKAGVR